MGTFIIKPTIVSSVVHSWFAYSGAPGFVYTTTDVDRLSGANNPAITALSLHNAGALTLFGGLDPTHSFASDTDDQIRFGFTGASIYLDGSLVPISSSGLPAGFTPLTLVATFRYNSQAASGTPKYYLQFDALTESANLWPAPVSPNMGSVLFHRTGVIPSMLDILLDGMGIRIDNTGFPANAGAGEFVGVELTGTYELQNFQFDMPIDVQPVTRNSTQITVTSDPNDPNHLKLDQLSEIDVTYGANIIPAPLGNIITQTEFLLIFIIFWTFGDEPEIVEPRVVGNGTQFSGSVLLGKLETIFFLNAPGIYKIDTQATADTLYDIQNGGTIEIAIPDPFFKTGFIG